VGVRVVTRAGFCCWGAFLALLIVLRVVDGGSLLGA
jgi:hypothetical protein